MPRAVSDGPMARTTSVLGFAPCKINPPIKTPVSVPTNARVEILRRLLADARTGGEKMRLAGFTSPVAKVVRTQRA